MIGQPQRQQISQDIQIAVDAGARLDRACQTIGLHPRTLKRWRINQPQHHHQIAADRRPHALRAQPAHALSEQERHTILQTCNQADYAQLPPTQIVPKLADLGIYLASERSFYRILKQANQLSPRGRQRPRQASRPISTHQATAPNQLWTWDITYLPSQIRGEFYYLYSIQDLYSRKIVAWEIHHNESAEHAAALMQLAQHKEQPKAGLILHSDNGAAMKGQTLLHKLYELGINSSRSRPRVSNDNAYIESFFRTLKYCPQYPSKGFADLTCAREWTQGFMHWYNHQHQHSGIRFVTPDQRHTGADKVILQKRQVLYQAAKLQHPRRWTQHTRNWSYQSVVWLNPERPDTKDQNDVV